MNAVTAAVRRDIEGPSMPPRADFGDDPCRSPAATHAPPISAAQECDVSCTDFGFQPDFRAPTRENAMSASAESRVFSIENARIFRLR